MKRIIRLTESDLTRIVRRVLNEGPDVINLKFWNKKRDRDSNKIRDYILKTTNHTFKGNSVYFDAIDPNTNKPAKFYSECGGMEGRITMYSTSIPKYEIPKHITKSGENKLTNTFCPAYITKPIK